MYDWILGTNPGVWLALASMLVALVLFIALTVELARERAEERKFRRASPERPNRSRSTGCPRDGGRTARR